MNVRNSASKTMEWLDKRVKFVSPNYLYLDGTTCTDPIIIGDVPVSSIFPVIHTGSTYVADINRGIHFQALNMLKSKINSSVANVIYNLDTNSIISNPGYNQIILDLVTALKNARVNNLILFPLTGSSQSIITSAVRFMLTTMYADTGRPKLKQIDTVGLIKLILYYFFFHLGDSEDGFFMAMPKVINPSYTIAGSITPISSSFAPSAYFNDTSLYRYLRGSMWGDSTLSPTVIFDVPAGVQPPIDSSIAYNLVTSHLKANNAISTIDVNYVTTISASHLNVDGLGSYMFVITGLTGDFLFDRFHPVVKESSIFPKDTGYFTMDGDQKLNIMISLVRVNGSTWNFIKNWSTGLSEQTDFIPIIVRLTGLVTPSYVGDTYLGIDLDFVRQIEHSPSHQGMLPYSRAGSPVSINIHDHVNLTQLWIDLLYSRLQPLSNAEVVADILRNTKKDLIDPVMYRELAKNITADRLVAAENNMNAFEHYVSNAIVDEQVVSVIEPEYSSAPIEDLPLPKLVDEDDEVESIEEVTLSEALVIITEHDANASRNNSVTSLFLTLPIDLPPSHPVTYFDNDGTAIETTYSDLTILYNQVTDKNRMSEIYSRRIGLLGVIMRDEAEDLMVKVQAAQLTEQIDETVAGLIESGNTNVADVTYVVDDLVNKTITQSSNVLKSADTKSNNLQTNADNIQAKMRTEFADISSLANQIVSTSSKNLTNNTFVYASVAMTKFCDFVNKVKNFADISRFINPQEPDTPLGMQKTDVFAHISAMTEVNQLASAVYSKADTAVAVLGGFISSLAKKGFDAVTKVVNAADGSLVSYRIKPYGLNTLDVPASMSVYTWDEFNTSFPFLAINSKLTFNDGIVRVIHYGSNYFFFQPMNGLVYFGINPEITMFNLDEVSDDFKFAKLLANSMIIGLHSINATLTAYNSLLQPFLWDTLTLIPIPAFNDLLAIATRSVTYEKKGVAERKTASLLMFGAGLALTFLIPAVGVALVVAAAATYGSANAMSNPNASLEDKFGAMSTNPDLANKIRPEDLVGMWQTYIPASFHTSIIFTLDLASYNGYLHDGTGQTFTELLGNGENLGFIPLVYFSQAPRFRFSILTGKDEVRLRLAAIATIVIAIAAVTTVAFLKMRKFKAKKKLRNLDREQWWFDKPQQFLPDGTVNPNFVTESKTKIKAWNKMSRKQNRLGKIFNTTPSGSSMLVGASAVNSLLADVSDLPSLDVIKDQQILDSIELAYMKGKIG